MLTNYSVGDYLIKIKNAAMAKSKEVSAATTKERFAIAKALKTLGYFEEVSNKDGQIVAKFVFISKKPILMDIKLVSKPGKRVYLKVNDMGKKRGPSTLLVSTPKGVLSTKEAVKANVGGEVIAEIW